MNVTEALAEVEASIAADYLDDAVEQLGRIAAALLERAPEPVALAHATWLAGAVALREGDQAAFERLTRDAVHGLRLAGEDAWAAGVRASREELVAQLGDVRRVQRDGAAGLMAVIERHVGTLREIAAGDGWDDAQWPAVNRQRALLPALAALVETTTGEPAPLTIVFVELELDPVESVLLATMASLTRAGEALLPNRLARFCFGDWRSHDEALLRLRDDGRLAVGRALAVSDRGELSLAASVMARLYGR
jgi:hypothetical protein